MELRGFGLLNMRIEFRERFLLPGDPDLATASSQQSSHPLSNRPDGG